MPIIPGSSAKLNTVHGLSTVMKTTSAEETALATKILPAGMLVKKSDGMIYLTDGVSTLANIPVLIDRALANIEKIFLSSAVSNGAYTRAAGGVVVHDSTGKISDDSLNIVTSGKITESYLSDYIDPVTHKVLLSALPDTVRAGVTYVADIDTRDACTDEQKKSLVFVIDATDDETVESGAAMYGWDTTANDGDGAWVKIAEVESLDIDVAAIRCDYPNTEAAGAVMYNHTIHLHPTTTTEFINLAEAAEGSDSLVDTIHDETSDYSEMGWGNFIYGLSHMTTGSSDVYLKAGQNSDTLYARIVSETFNFGTTTLTVVDNTTNTSVSIPVAATAANEYNTGVLILDQTAKTTLSPVVYNGNDHPVTVSVSDGQYICRNTTYANASAFCNALYSDNYVIDLDNDSNWVSDVLVNNP